MSVQLISEPWIISFISWSGRIVEIYIDDVVVKSKSYKEHLANLWETLHCIRKHGLKMNPSNCAFIVSAREFLGFMVYERGIEVGQKSMKAIDEAVPPTNKTQLQSLVDKINFIRRFISNLSERMLSFSPLLKLKANQEFRWDDIQQKAFDEIKEYMKSPPVLISPQHGKPFKLYVSADVHTIGSSLM